MAPRNFPHTEDNHGIAGGDSVTLQRSRARPVAFTAGAPMGQSPASPPGEGKSFVGATSRGSFRNKDSRSLARAAGRDEIENDAQRSAEDDGSDEQDDEDEAPAHDFLALVREADATSSRYLAQTNRRAWTQSLRAYNSEHYQGSKYGRTDWANRSRFFRPKTRTAVKKDMAAVAASLFGNIDAINCLPGNESDPRQRAAAAVMEELINYRTNGSNGQAAIPWFLVAMGARQDALIAGICLSKQTWKLELRKDKPETANIDGPDGQPRRVVRDVWVAAIDRPNCESIPPENFTMDPAAEWTDPIQSASYVIIRWPMQVGEVRKKQESPVNKWNDVAIHTLLATSDSGTTDTSAIRRAREQGMDRMDESQATNEFQIVWVNEVYMRVDGIDYTFFSAGDKAYLTDPRPTRDVYPEQNGERPLVMGFGNLDAHRIFPMSPVASWQPHQGELNDIVNLRLDAVKQNVFPVTKVVKGKGVDIDQVKRRGHGTTLMLQDKDDITFDRPTDIPESVAMMTREIELELDDLAGQFNGQTAEHNNALSRTLGGLKLVAGSANAVQEFDIRVWIETWTAKVLAQIVRLEQYYEHDDVVLGLCGDRAQLFEKHGISKITDDLIEQNVVVHVSVGLGAGDPQQRMMKFSQAVSIAAPLLEKSPEFQSGEMEIDTVAVCEEIFGAAGYRDGGARFFKKGKPKPQGDPLMDLKAAELKSKVTKNLQTGKAALITALAAAAKQALGEKAYEDEAVDTMIGRMLEATDMGHRHGHQHNTSTLAAMEHGHRHGMAIRTQGHQERQPQVAPGGDDDALSPQGGGSGGGAPQQGGDDMGGQPPAGPQPGAGAPPSGGPDAGAPPDNQGVPASMSLRQAQQEPAPPQDSQPNQQQQYFEFVRGADGRIAGLRLGGQPPQAQPAGPPMPPPGPPPLPPFAQPGA